MFYTSKEPGKGTGLGLSVAYNIVQSHGGKITLESNKGKGTIARVNIPILNKKTS
ncbi:MAG: HAMP domain-containing sensor histidine kinase [Planctomycetota bacterium]